MRKRRPVVYLHIGAMKTGTTFLQQLMTANKQALYDAGVLFPGDRWSEQVLATREALGLTMNDPRIVASSAGLWDRLTAQMLAHEGAASVFSMEFLSYADRDEARRIMDTLKDAELHVVLTVRDAVRAIPAQWQTFVRNQGPLSWPDFAHGVRRAPEGGKGLAARTFRRTQDIPRMLDAWRRPGVFRRARLHVVTVPRPGAPQNLIWDRFAQVIGVDPAVASEQPEFSNPSLGHASADLMRRVNTRLGRMQETTYRPTVTEQLADKILAARAKQEGRTPMYDTTYRFALDWNRQVRDAIRRSGAELVGDLDDLPVHLPDGYEPVPDEPLLEPTPEETAAAAATALDGLWDLVDHRVSRLQKVQPDYDGALPARPERPAGPVSARRWDGAEDPADAATAEVADLLRLAMDLHERIRAPRRSA